MAVKTTTPNRFPAFPRWRSALRIKFWLQQWSWYRSIHLRYVEWRATHAGLPNWKVILENSHEPLPCEDFGTAGIGSRVLLATSHGGHLPSLTLESTLAMALRQRGATVEFLLCDGALTACMMSEINWYSDVLKFARTGPVDRCQSCFRPAARLLDEAGIPFVGLGTLISDDERKRARSLSIETPVDRVAAFEMDGIPVGEHAMAGALRFFARGDLSVEDHGEAVLRRYFEASLCAYYGSMRLLSSGRYDVVVLNHGIYVPQGIIAGVARKLGVRVVTWHPAYRRSCFIFNHNETYHHGLMNEPVSEWEDMHWNNTCRDEIQRYLQSRWSGVSDWVSFHRDPLFEVESLEREVGIDLSRPTVGLLTNVVWDAQLHYRANAFPGMIPWLVSTISYFERRPDLQLLIRIHPAEVTGTLPSRQPAAEEIRRAFPRLPRNVFIIGPESRLSTYVAMSRCNAVVIYGTKTGVELTATGKPVIVAGEAWIRGKGMTQDATSEQDYFRILDTLPGPGRLDDSRHERALRYAYHFFFRRMIPLEFIVERKGWPPFEVSIREPDELRPNASVGLDVVCRGIIQGTPFVFPAESVSLASAPRREDT